jgi:hypothetical protein
MNNLWFVGFCSYSVLPESPRWLISKGHFEHAERILRRIAKTNKTHFDSTAYKRLVNAEKKVIIISNGTLTRTFLYNGSYDLKLRFPFIL